MSKPTNAGNTSVNISTLPTSLQLYHQKQQEYAGLQALKEASAALLARVDKLAEMSNVMADGGEAIGGVLRNWPHVFAILNMFDNPVNTSPDATTEIDDEAPEPIPVLVRLPYGNNNTESTEQTR